MRKTRHNHKPIVATNKEGRVNWFRSDLEYGFIISDDGDLFVHASNLPEEFDGYLFPNQKVVFDVAQGRKGMEAINIKDYLTVTAPKNLIDVNKIGEEVVENVSALLPVSENVDINTLVAVLVMIDKSLDDIRSIAGDHKDHYDKSEHVIELNKIKHEIVSERIRKINDRCTGEIEAIEVPRLVDMAGLEIIKNNLDKIQSDIDNEIGKINLSRWDSIFYENTIDLKHATLNKEEEIRRTKSIVKTEETEAELSGVGFESYVEKFQAIETSEKFEEACDDIISLYEILGDLQELDMKTDAKHVVENLCNEIYDEIDGYYFKFGDERLDKVVRRPFQEKNKMLKRLVNTYRGSGKLPEQLERYLRLLMEYHPVLTEEQIAGIKEFKVEVNYFKHYSIHCVLENGSKESAYAYKCLQRMSKLFKDKWDMRILTELQEINEKANSKILLDSGASERAVKQAARLGLLCDYSWANIPLEIRALIDDVIIRDEKSKTSTRLESANRQGKKRIVVRKILLTARDLIADASLKISTDVSNGKEVPASIIAQMRVAIPDVSRGVLQETNHKPFAHVNLYLYGADGARIYHTTL